eukprot:snap_masked-scaffold_2-processed-gene-9.41-mRNA-1 protein AED:1.00 eAED:1.00 QI:0/-1/0/0/-1/1/1/0/317
MQKYSHTGRENKNPPKKDNFKLLNFILNYHKIYPRVIRRLEYTLRRFKCVEQVQFLGDGNGDCVFPFLKTIAENNRSITCIQINSDILGKTSKKPFKGISNTLINKIKPEEVVFSAGSSAESYLCLNSGAGNLISVINSAKKVTISDVLLYSALKGNVYQSKFDNLEFLTLENSYSFNRNIDLLYLLSNNTAIQYISSIALGEFKTKTENGRCLIYLLSKIFFNNKSSKEFSTDIIIQSDIYNELIKYLFFTFSHLKNTKRIRILIRRLGIKSFVRKNDKRVNALKALEQELFKRITKEIQWSFYQGNAECVLRKIS